MEKKMLRQAFISLVGTFAVLLPFLATAAVDLPPSITQEKVIVIKPKNIKKKL
jgi:hypothetical protein